MVHLPSARLSANLGVNSSIASGNVSGGERPRQLNAKKTLSKTLVNYWYELAKRLPRICSAASQANGNLFIHSLRLRQAIPAVVQLRGS